MPKYNSWKTMAKNSLVDPKNMFAINDSKVDNKSAVKTPKNYLIFKPIMVWEFSFGLLDKRDLHYWHCEIGQIT